MRHATLVLILILVGCIDVPTADDQSISDRDDGGEVIVGVKPTHAPDECPGGDGGRGADPNPIPAPKDCTVETDHEACYQCCDWNVDKVWGERCRRLPMREREPCWADAENRRGDCQRKCPILTVTP